ncbi:MAG: hypothetical protein O6951_05700, partial [Actinobacteria bacterium]|nr:hypothetical protein [Actinomycetota bacterium]
ADGEAGRGANGGWTFAAFDASDSPGVAITLNDVDLIAGTGGTGGDAPTSGPTGVATATNFT